MIPITATDFRKNMFSFLDQVEKQKTPFSFRRKGKIFNVSVDQPSTKGRLSWIREPKKDILIGEDNIDDINWIDEWSEGKDL